MSGTKRAASDSQQLPSKRRATSPTPPDDNRTLVCAVRGLPGRVCTVTVRPDATVHHLKELIHQQNAVQLTGVDPTTFDVYSAKDPKQGRYFPREIPAVDSGVVHVVVDFVFNPLPCQVEELGTAPLPDDKPTASDEEVEEETERFQRVREALGLFVCWSISGTDFSQKHDYPGAKWLEYGGYGDRGTSRVYIGDKTTWRELYVACNQVVEMHEGRVAFRWVEGFNQTRGRSALYVGIGT
ncbi:hypothetical protein PHYPSEUDO_007187 [Phytophthora pseudosyringae]|uniref:Crinkler effector protein N-terminal domain-containing protein n=1 Tax=Phytophthora pseudosyringae TaxID=221518 RepID=A0A8T1VH06_9STRA|nr:hypothetical protein PHYPSEUDO_007187 [Phytophthora pseudosyringae]